MVPLEAEPDVDPDVGLVPPSEPDTLAPEEVAPLPPAEALGSGDPSAPGEPQPGAGEPPHAEQPGDGSEPAPLADGDAERAAEQDLGPEPAGNQRRGYLPAGEKDGSRQEAAREHDGESDAAGEQDGGSNAAAQDDAASEPAHTETGGSEWRAEPAAAATASRQTTNASASLRHARSHVVAPGDSLWSIAKRILGPDASMAGVAREVNRLWSLNEARIGTGDPDLLMVGARLRLR